MPDPSWDSVGSRIARYGKRVRALVGPGGGPARDAAALAAWAGVYPWRAAELRAVQLESAKIDESLRYLWSRAPGESLREYRARERAA